MAFIIYATQRSGTQMLTTALDSHPRLRCLPEVPWIMNASPSHWFSQDLYDRSAPVNPKLLVNSNGPRSIRNFISLLKKNEGANIKYGQIKHNVTRMDPTNNKIIHLVRINLLDTVISNLLNKQKQKWGLHSHVYLTDDQYPKNCSIKHFRTNATEHFFEQNRPKTIRLDKGQISGLLRETESDIRRNIQNLKPYSKNVLTVFYEDLIPTASEANQINEKIGQQICEFLNVENEKLYPATLKTKDIWAPRKYENFIENYNDIKLLEKKFPRKAINTQ